MAAGGLGLGACCCPGCCWSLSLEFPSPPWLRAAALCRHSAERQVSPAGLGSCTCPRRAPLPRGSGAGGAVWVRHAGDISLPPRAACSSHHLHPTAAGVGLDIRQPWGFLSSAQARRRYLVCPPPMNAFFIPYTETPLRTASEEEEIQRGPGFQGGG